LTHLQRNGVQEAQGSELAAWSSEISQYRLLSRLHEICRSINQAAGHEIVHADQGHRQDETLFRCTVERRGSHCGMELTLPKTGPTVVFWLREPTDRDTGAGDRRLRVLPEEPSGTRVIHQLAVDPQDLDNSELKLWFVYLMSGFRSALAPKTNVLQAPRKAA